MVKAEGTRQKAQVRNARSLANHLLNFKMMASVSAFRTSALYLLPCALLLALPRPASADLVRLTSGKILSVESWQIKGDTAVLVLRDGGEMQAPESLIVEVLPDEYLHATTQLLPESMPRPAVRPLVSSVDDIHSMVDLIAARYGVDVTLARAVVKVESDFQPRVVSPKGAMGLMQIMPSVAQQYAVDDPFDPEKNLDAGLRVLRGLLDRFNDVRTALAAYNAGLMAVAKYGGIPPFRETQDYVQRIMALATR